MAGQPLPRDGIRMRLARHYLGKLRTASLAVQRGQASLSAGLSLFDQEWEQIKHWQAWSARHSLENTEWGRLCQAFPLAGSDVLQVRTYLADQAAWLEAALAAASNVQDWGARLRLQHDLGGVYFRLGNLDQAEQIAGQLLADARETGDKLAVGRGHYGLGAVAEERGSYEQAERHYQKALVTFLQLMAREEEGRVLNGLGSLALYTGDFQNAYEYFLRYLEIIEGIGNRNELCIALMAVGQALLMLQEDSRAEMYIRRAVELSRALGFQWALGAALIMLGSWAVEQNQLQLGCRYYEEGVEAARAVGSQRNVIHGLSSLGYARLRQEDLDGARLALQEGLSLAREAGIPRYICNLQRNLADTFLAREELDLARPALIEALEIALELGSEFQLAKALTSAAAYWQRRGEPVVAARWVGSLRGRPGLDLALFQPLCQKLESILGAAAYQQALEQGRALTPQAITADILENAASLSSKA